MGRVFSWREISSGRVPELDNFNLIGQILREELANCPAIIGALICGSFLRGDHNKRSDIDCVALYYWERRREAVKFFQKLSLFSTDLCVPLEIIPVDSGLASTPNHHLASTFIDHLLISSKEPGSIIKMNPVPFLHFETCNFRLDTIEYLKHKARRFDKGEASLLTISSEQRLRLVQKALEFPVYAARKVLRCLGEDFTRGDSKREILRIYLSLSGLSEAKEILEESFVLDRWYSEQLELQIEEKNRRSYLSVIKKLQAFVPKALEFARMNLLIF
jgi:hypothetical protein